MAGELQETLDRLKAKTRIVADRYALIVTQRDEALKRIAQLEEESARQQRQISDLQRQIEFLRVATTIAPERADVERTRSLLSELVRDIDKCIAELNE